MSQSGSSWSLQMKNNGNTENMRAKTGAEKFNWPPSKLPQNMTLKLR